MNQQLHPRVFDGFSPRLLAGLFLVAALGCSTGPAPNGPAGVGAPASPASSGVERMERLYAEDPGQLHLAYYLASAEAQAGRAEPALRWLEILAEKGWDLGVLPLDLGALAGDPRLASTLGRLRDLVSATSASEPAFRIPERDLIPEGIAHDPRSGDFFVGSLRHHKILRVSPGGTISTLVAGEAGGLGPVLGLEVDPARGWLWAVSGGSEASAPDSQRSRESAIFAFDLRDGSRVGRYSLGASAEGVELNDLCVAKSGAVFATATGTGAIVHLAPEGRELVELVPSGRLFSPNGIVCWPHGERLIVADALGLAAVEIATGSVRRLAAPAGRPDRSGDRWPRPPRRSADRRAECSRSGAGDRRAARPRSRPNPRGTPARDRAPGLRHSHHGCRGGRLLLLHRQ